MAGRGPAGKESHTRKRDDQEFTTLSPAVVLYGSPLPDGILPDDDTWHPQTLALWESLRRSSLLANEPELGWQFLIDTALMHHQMWRKGRWDFASEVRLRVAKFGATPEDRMRLKVKIDAPGASSGPSAVSEAKVTDIRSRRTRLSG